MNFNKKIVFKLHNCFGITVFMFYILVYITFKNRFLVEFKKVVLSEEHGMVQFTISK